MKGTGSQCPACGSEDTFVFHGKDTTAICRDCKAACEPFRRRDLADRDSLAARDLLHAGAVREHLSRSEIYGRALLWWTSPGTAAFGHLSDLAQNDPDITTAAEALQAYLRDRLSAVEDADILIGAYLSPEAAGANFDRQQEIMRKLPNDIGKARPEGRLGMRQQQLPQELESLKLTLPQESVQWQEIFQQPVTSTTRT